MIITTMKIIIINYVNNIKIEMNLLKILKFIEFIEVIYFINSIFFVGCLVRTETHIFINN